MYSPDWDRPRSLPINEQTSSRVNRSEVTFSNTTHNASPITNHNSNLNSNTNSNRHTNQNTTRDRNVGIQPTQHSAIKPLRIDLTEEPNQITARARVTNIDDAVEASSNPNMIATITQATMVTQHNGQTSC